MTRLIVSWILSGLSLMIVAWVIPGVHVSGFVTALIAALIIGLVNATLGLFFKIITLPLAILTFGIFLLIVNAAMLKLAASLVPGFEVRGFAAAFFGAILLSVVNVGLRWVFYNKD